MDDPVQSMDDINIFSFVDVLRGMLLNSTSKWQLFLSTHDRKIFSFLKKKFRIFNLLVLDFRSYGMKGPEINKSFFKGI